MGKEYALYREDSLIGIGTVEELAEMVRVKPSTIKWYMTPSGSLRGHGTVVVRIDLEGEEDDKEDD